jgi:UDP-GlcNAc:undecaprenyl-phosphate GlcNAc-1-phosphate transferase
MITTLLIKILLLFVATFLLLKLAIPRAHKVGLIDVPNDRSAHKIPVPRGAGIVFGFVFLLGVLMFYYFHMQTTAFSYTFLSLLIVYATGVYDDFKDISSKNKFLFIILATVIAFYDGFGITSLGHYFGYELTLGYLALPFTIFAVVGFTNAINLTDGLDGLAGSISIVILSGLLYIGIIQKDELLICLSILLISPVAAFLVFNWYPAKVFMGDSGSLFLGFTIALLSIYALKYINPSSILFLAAIPLLDTLMVMKRRRQRKQSLFVADKNHLHHILLNFKKDKLFTVSSLIKFQILFVLIFVQVYQEADFINLILFLMLFSIFFNLFDPRMSHRRKIKPLKVRSLRKKD